MEIPVNTTRMFRPAIQWKEGDSNPFAAEGMNLKNSEGERSVGDGSK